MKKILIIGGTGFIGKKLIQKLASFKYSIYVISRHFVKSRYKNIHYIKADLTNLKSLSRIKKYFRNSYLLIDLASYIPQSSSLKSSDQNLKFFFNINILGKINLLKVLDNNVKRLIYISTIDVYGDSEGIYTEDSSTNPTSYYGATKLATEKIYQVYCKQKCLKLTILRLSQVYGAGEPMIKAIPKLIDKIVNKKSISLYGNGIEKRRFIYIGDVVDAITNLLRSNKVGIYNIAGEEITSIKQLLRTIEKILGSKAVIIKKPLNKATHKIMSINKAKKELKFFPKVSMKEGLSKMIKEMYADIF